MGFVETFFSNYIFSIRQVFCDKNCSVDIAEPANKAFQIWARKALSLINDGYRSGISSITLLEENMISTPMSHYFPAYSPLFEIFNEKIHQLLAGGFFFYWDENYYNSKLYVNKPEEIGPQVLTMEHLKVGFLVCLCPLILSIVIFFGECACKMFFRF